MTAPRPLSESLRLYRDHCVEAGQKAQESYDKAVLALSGGGLGVSLAFLKDVVGAGPVVSPELLHGAWLAWTCSIVGVLASYFSSRYALDVAVRQVDAGTIHTEPPGRVFSKATVLLNAAAGILFLVGVILMLLFVFDNLGPSHGR